MSTTDLTVNPFLLIGSSFSFAVGLAWNDLIQTGIKEYFTDDQGFRAKAIYAILITAIIIMIAFVLNYLNNETARLNADIARIDAEHTQGHQYTEKMRIKGG